METRVSVDQRLVTEWACLAVKVKDLPENIKGAVADLTVCIREALEDRGDRVPVEVGSNAALADDRGHRLKNLKTCLGIFDRQTVDDQYLKELR